MPADTVLGLETNRRFVESYMVGLNVEMGRELLWRGFPSNQLGTYFDHFWGGGADIKPLHTWGDRPLADAPSSAPRENFVMLLRSALLRRYPNALIYLARAVKDPAASKRVPTEDVANEKQPVFNGVVQPDINFFGFDVTPAQAVGSATDPGYYVVIQQHPTEPRFGLDASVSVGNASHLSIAAGKPAQVPAAAEADVGLQRRAHGRHHAPPPGAPGDPRLEFQSSLSSPPASQSPASILSRPPVTGVVTAPVATR